MALTTSETNQVRVDVLGVSVDESTTWTTTGPQGNRNALDVLITERVVTRLLNDVYARLGAAVTATNGFAGRFSAVVGEEAGADQTAFDGLGTNLIQAIAAGGGGGSFVFSQPTPALTWSISHNLGRQFCAVQIVDDGGTTVLADVDYIDDDDLTITFARAKAGTAVIRR